MNQAPKDVQTVIRLVKNLYGRVIGLQDSTLTTIQREQATTRLQQTLADEGVTYAHTQDESGEKLFSFSNLCMFGILV